MKRYGVTITTNNAAFGEDPADELARILRDLAQRIDRDGCESVITLRDINGNRVGSAGWE